MSTVQVLGGISVILRCMRLRPVLPCWPCKCYTASICIVCLNARHQKVARAVKILSRRMQVVFSPHHLPPEQTRTNVLHLQVNYLGPYHLTRLLEPVLIASKPSRIVNLSSIMHRSGHVDADVQGFLSDWRKGSQYSNTKLANVAFTYEAQRRLAPLGVQV